MRINNIEIWDTFAEAFPMKCTRLIITAENLKWAMNAAIAFTGFATSVIASFGFSADSWAFFNIKNVSMSTLFLSEEGKEIQILPSSAKYHLSIARL